MQEMTLREQQLFSLDILKDVHEFCIRNNIRYSLAYGTLIGAVRHKGFIPWDNDIDVCMPRPDYEHFCREYKSEHYEIAYTSSEKKCNECLIAYARVCDCKKTFATGCCWCKKKMGVWIDVFPLDGIPDSKTMFQQHYACLRTEWLNLQKKRIRFCRFSDQNGFFQKIKLFMKKVIYFNGFKGKKLQLDYIKKISAVPYDVADHFSQLAVMDNGPVEYVPKSAFDSMILLPFEDSYFYVMNGYKIELEAVYGDYMKMPPKEHQVPHQSYIKFFYK